MTSTFRSTYWITLVLNGGTSQGVFFILAGLAVIQAQDPFSIGLQLMAQSLPSLALLVLIRTASTRLNFRSALVWSLSLQGVTALTFAIFSVLFGYSLTAALIISAAYGLTSSVQTPGRRTVLADLYEVDSRRKALSRVTAYSNGARLVAPALAGVALALDLWPVWFILDAGLCFFSAWIASKAIRAIKTKSDNALPTDSQPIDMEPSLRARPVIIFLTAYLILCVFGFNIQVLAQITARDVLNNVTSYAGIIVSAHTAGSLVGAILVVRGDKFLRLLYGIGSIGLGLGFIGFLAQLGSSPISTFVAAFLAGIGRGLALTASSTMTATWSESSIFRERLIALTSIIFTASNIVSAVVIALCLLIGGATLTIIVCGLGSIVAGVLIFTISKDWETLSSESPMKRSQDQRGPVK